MHPQAAIPTGKDAVRRIPSQAYLRYFVAMTFCVLVVSYMDRQLIGVVMQAIKVDLALSDTALGLLGGAAFALFYGLFSMPIARLADTKVARRTVVAASIALWSVFAVLCGGAQNFAQLFIARVGVGVGEAGAMPASYAMVSDLFPAERRARVYALCGMGGGLGVVLGLAVGGWALANFGWRGAFVIMGAPGLLLALVYVLTIREPSRRVEGVGAGGSVTGTISALLAVRTYLLIVLGAASYTIGLNGIAAWVPTMLLRMYATSPASLGLVLAIPGATSTLLGALLGGVLADRLAVRDIRWLLWIPVMSCALAGPAAWLAFLWPDRIGTILFYCAMNLLLILPQAPVIAAVQLVIPATMRASAVALILLATSIVGQGGGVFLIGLLSDLTAPMLGRESLRVGLLVAGLAPVLGAWPLWLASISLRRDAVDQL